MNQILKNYLFQAPSKSSVWHRLYQEPPEIPWRPVAHTRDVLYPSRTLAQGPAMPETLAQRDSVTGWPANAFNISLARERNKILVYWWFGGQRVVEEPRTWSPGTYERTFVWPASQSRLESRLWTLVIDGPWFMCSERMRVYFFFFFFKYSMSLKSRITLYKYQGGKSIILNVVFLFRGDSHTNSGFGTFILGFKNQHIIFYISN